MDSTALPAHASPPFRSVPIGGGVLPTATAVLGTVAVLGLTSLLAPEGSWARTFLLERGWAQPLTLALFFWGLGHVLRRLVAQFAEQRALRACVEILRQEAIDRERVPGLLNGVARQSGSLSGDVLGAVLSYFRTHRPTRDEVMRVAGHAVDRAADRIDDEYAALGATLWLIPLSGFLGTVLGMSAAIGSFDAVIGAQSGDLTALVPSVRGLAVAFDTTLLALALVVPLKIVEVTTHRRDRGLLDAIDRSVGSGLVQELDLAGLAQQTAEERALDRYAETVDRIRKSLLQIDGLLGALTARVGTVSQVEVAMQDLGAAARAVRDAVPAIRADLASMRRQSEQPITLVRQTGREP